MCAWYTVHVYELCVFGYCLSVSAPSYMLAIQSKSLQQRLMQHHTTCDKMDQNNLQRSNIALATLFTQYLKRVAQLANELFYIVALYNKQSTYIHHKLQQTHAIKITRSK